MSDNDQSSTPRSSDRVLALLSAVVEVPGSTLTELAERVGLAPSTATRQLASLEHAGFVDRSALGYRPGPTLLSLAHRVVGQHPLPLLLQPILDRIAHDTGETTYLAVAHDDATAIYIAAAEGRRTLRVAGWRGRQVPRAGTAVGAALGGSATVEQPAIGCGTVEEGVTGISAPVVDVNGRTVAAISVLGPSTRLQSETLEAAVATLTAGARTAADLLGGTDQNQRRSRAQTKTTEEAR